MTARVADVEVAPGKIVHAWTYDGGIPGPLIRARVGDRVIVHFTNDLPQPTTLHWHGVRVPIAMDGIPGISQPEVTRGGTFTYDFVVHDAGLYWYHPHLMSAAQVGFGLYGALLVEDPGDGVSVADQITIVLSDIGFNRDGVLESPESGGPAGLVFGREGEYILANGRIMPTLRARSGAPQRWRIVNICTASSFCRWTTSWNRSARWRGRTRSMCRSTARSGFSSCSTRGRVCGCFIATSSTMPRAA